MVKARIEAAIAPYEAKRITHYHLAMSLYLVGQDVREIYDDSRYSDIRGEAVYLRDYLEGQMALLVSDEPAIADSQIAGPDEGRSLLRGLSPVIGALSRQPPPPPNPCD